MEGVDVMNNKYSKLILASIISSLLVGLYSSIISNISINTLSFTLIALISILIQLCVHTYIGIKYVLVLLNKTLRINCRLIINVLDADYSNLYNNSFTKQPSLKALGVCRC